MRRRRSSGLTAAAGLGLVLVAGGCGGGGAKKPKAVPISHATPVTATTVTAAAPRPKPKPPALQFPKLIRGALRSPGAKFVPVVLWRGRPAASIAQAGSGVTLLSFDQRLVVLRLHAGTEDPGTAGWRYGPQIAGLESKRAVAAFNGGFRFSSGVGGFEEYGRVAEPLQDGLGSIVTYADGRTDVGSWHHGVPAPGRKVATVRQNQGLLIDHGQPDSNAGCDSCWGATLGGVADPARAAVGVTGNGTLIWGAGENVTVSQLAGAMVSAHVARAVELDINPEWVAGYVYAHSPHTGIPSAVPALPNQQGIGGEFLSPWSRDFFAVAAR